MTRLSSRHRVRATVIAAAFAAATLGPAAPAHAANYQVVGVDGQGLAMQSEPHINHVVDWLPNGTSIDVVCQVNNGDQVDGRTQYNRPFTTWDKLSNGYWVYDWYTNTPTVATDGYSPGIPHCNDATSPPALAAGCVDWPSSKYLQTPLTSSANNGLGYVYANPHYGTDYHIGCNTGNMNQNYAVDLPMLYGDAVLSPGGAGTVKWAAQAPPGWETCGLYVVVDHGGGWWSVVCHLSAIYVTKGQQITNNTVIGAVGGTGGFEPHLHFSLMKGALLTTAGGVYGGQSARARHVYHLGCTTGYYDWIAQNQKICY